MKITFLFIGILLCNISLAQNRPQQVDTLVNNLRKKGIDTILIYMQSAVWNVQEKPDTPARSKCHCSLGDFIYAVNVIFINHGKIYKLDYACCEATNTVKLQNSLSITYFLLQKRALIMPKNYFSQHKRFPPPLPTDYPWEDVELILAKKDYSFELYSYKSSDGYKIWKKYPWINKQIRLIKLIRRDLNIDKQ